MKKSARDRAYDWVRERILDGTLPGGAFVDESAICEGAGVSRTPAREALHTLEGERYITMAPRRGAQVRVVNSTDLFDAYRARFMVERAAVEEFCSRALDVPASVYTAIDEMEALANFARTPVIVAYLEANHQLHASIVQTLNNRAVSDFYESLWRMNQWPLITRSSWLRSADYTARNRAEHRQFVAALERHDADAATRILQTHLSPEFGDHV